MGMDIKQSFFEYVKKEQERVDYLLELKKTDFNTYQKRIKQNPYDTVYTKDEILYIYSCEKKQSFEWINFISYIFESIFIFFFSIAIIFYLMQFV